MLDLNDYIKIWLRSRCPSDTQIRTASQMSTVKQENPMWNSCRRILTLFEELVAAFLFIWCGNGVPTPLFLALYTSAIVTLQALPGLDLEFLKAVILSRRSSAIRITYCFYCNFSWLFSFISIYVETKCASGANSISSKQISAFIWS